jgi:NTE family protein
MQLFSRAMSFAAPLFIGCGWLEGKLQAMRFHMLQPRQTPSMERPETRLLAHMPYLEMLRGQGR